MHPLHAALVDAAHGRFPDVDGLVDVYVPDGSGTVACVEFTGHSVVLTDRERDEVMAHGADGYGGAMHPDLLRWLAGPAGTIGCHDAVLVASGTGGGSLPERDDLEHHPRVVRARHHRRDVHVHGNEFGLVTIGVGLVGRLEVSVELFDPVHAPNGTGGELIAEALRLIPVGDLLWAEVSPGNAASLRAFLRCGFMPIGAEVLIEPVLIEPVLIEPVVVE